MTKRTGKSIAPRAAKGKQGLAPSPGYDTYTVSSPRESILRRIQEAVVDVVDMSDEGEILEALSTPTSIDALIHLVGNAHIASKVAAKFDDPLRAARARAVQQRLKLMKEEGGLIGVEDVADRLRLTRAGVDKRRQSNRLLAVDTGSRTVAYPAWQFTEASVLSGLETVLAKFTIKDGLMQMSFFLTFDPELSARPLDALKQGRIDEVAAAAMRFGRFGDDG